MSAHNRNRRVRGKASEHLCEHCGRQAREWSYDRNDPNEMVDNFGRYSLDPMHYIALCKPCHQRFDKSEITHCPHGHPYEGENLIIDAGKRKCRTCVYARNTERRKRIPMTAEQHERKMALQRKRRRAASAAKRAAQALDIAPSHVYG